MTTTRRSALSSSSTEYALWRVAAPRAVDENATALAVAANDSARWMSAFDQVWQTLKSMYYTTGEPAPQWDALATEVPAGDGARRRTPRRPKRHRSDDRRAAVDQAGGRVAAGGRGVRPSARVGSRCAILERGGNVVDAGIAVSFALGVVEPDASSIGGDGQAILFLKGMSEPVVIEYKDMTPSRATPDNPKIFTPTGARTAADGPTVATIPGVVAGLDLLYQKYGSKKVQWADLVAPAIKIADEGFILDEALPTTIAEGRASFAKYPESAKLFIPNGKADCAGRSLRQQGLRRDAADDRQGRRAVVLSRIDRASASRPTWRPTAASSRRRSRAVPRDGAQAARRQIPRPPGLLGAGAGLDRAADRRDAADSRQLPRGPARPSRTMPTSCTTRSRPGACATAARASRIPSAGRSISAITSSRRTRSSGSS